MSENVKPSEILRPLYSGNPSRYGIALWETLDSFQSRLTALESKPEAASEPPTPSPRTGEPQDPEGEVTFTKMGGGVYAWKGGKWCVCHEDGTFGEWINDQQQPNETDLPRAEAERLRPAIKTRFPVSDPYPHWHDAKHGNVARLDSPTSGEFFYASGDRDLVTKYTIAHCHSGHYPRIPYARACELNPHVPKVEGGFGDNDSWTGPDPVAEPAPQRPAGEEAEWVNRYIQCYPPNNGRGILKVLTGFLFR